MKRFLLKKEKGQSDLIAAMMVVLGLSVFILFFVSAIGDVLTRTEIDQVARKYILRMESQGSLPDSEKAALINDLKRIKSVKQSGQEPTVVWKVGGNTNTKGKYGDTIELTITCPAVTTSWALDNTSVVGGVHKNRVINYVVTKQSTAKY